MSQSDQSKVALISGIAEDAAEEEHKILDDAEKKAADKRTYGDKKLASLLDEARQRAQEQGDAIKRKVLSGVELEIKRRSLKVRDTVMKQVMDRVEEKLKDKLSDPGYRSILRDWILEAVIGLDVDVATLNASAAERPMIDEGLLKDVVATIQQRSGKTVTITLANTDPLEGQGIVLTAHGGRMAFNNQVRTRMMRNSRKIQTLIHEKLFE